VEDVEESGIKDLSERARRRHQRKAQIGASWRWLASAHGPRV